MKKKRSIGDGNNANVSVENAVEVAKGNLVDNVSDMTGFNVEVDADIKGVVEMLIDSQDQLVDGKTKSQIQQEEKRKSIVAQSEERRKTAEQEHQHTMERMRFKREQEADKKNGYQVRQEEKRKNIALAEEERRKAAEIQNQLILEKEKLEVEKQRLTTERERLALEKEKTLLAKEKQKTIRALIIAVGCLIAFFIAALLL